MNKRFKVALIIVSLFFFNLSIGLCSAAVEVKGYGQTKDLALKDAMRMAIEMKVGSLIDSKTVVEKNQIISDTIYAKSEGYVKSYTILNEFKTGNSYCLTVQVVVDDSPNSALMSRLQSLKNIETNLNNPRIGVSFIRKANYYNRYIAVEIANSSVVNALGNKGFTRVLDLGSAYEQRGTETIYSLLMGNSEEAITLAKQNSVDYLIVGELKPSNVGNIMGSGVYSYRTSVTWKVINVGTSQIVATGSAFTSAVDITPDIAMEKSMDKIGNAVSDKIVEKLAATSMQISHSLLIKVRNMNSESFDKLVQNLSNVQGVEKCFVRFYQNQSGEIDINTSNLPYDMSLLLKNLGYKIVEINTNVVTISD